MRKASATVWIHVSVGKDGLTLATELERGPLERVGSGLLDDLSRVNVASEDDLVDIRMHDYGRAGDFTDTVDDIENARWKPASMASSARRKAVSGVCSAGLRTTVLPQAIAGPSFQASIKSGKFQGII